jgi:HAD superfamily hydrolase (TIGR01450 family)
MTPKASLNRWLEAQAANFDAVMLDIDGVLLNDKRRMPGSRRLFDLLGRHAKPFMLLTNDGNHSTAEKADRLNAAGLAVTPGQIVSCGHAIKAAVQARNLTGRLFFVMGDTGTPCYAQAAGLRITREIADLQKCMGVLIGEEHYDWESVINAVINYFIDHPDAPLIIPNPDEFYPGPRLKIHVAAGGIGRFIQRVLKVYGTDIDPLYLGKPYAEIFRWAQNTLEARLGLRLAARRILMIGDNISADIGGAGAMGYATALLLTGVTRWETVSNSDIIPDMVFQAL